MTSLRTSRPVALLAAVVLAGCVPARSSSDSGQPSSTPGPTVLSPSPSIPGPTTAPPSRDVPGPSAPLTQAQIYAAVIHRLVTKDHTFGGAASPFKFVYVVDGVVPLGERAPYPLGPAAEEFPESIKRRVEEILDDLPPLEFIQDPDSVRLGPEGAGGVKNDGVIISLGPIEWVRGEIQVATGLWCGGRCGQWLTYVLSEQEDGWKIIDTTGPIAIS